MDADNQDRLSRALAADEETLFESIGHFVTADMGMADLPRDEVTNRKRQAGKDWFMRNLSVLQDGVCKNESVKKFILNMQSSDAIQLAFLVADGIAGATGIVPPFLIAALMVKMGLGKICHAYWT